MFETGSLADACETAVSRLRTRAEAEGIVVALQVCSSVPALRLDRAAMADAVENLVDDAVKYSPAGSRVEVAVRADGPHVLVEVSDSGSGIDPDDLPRIFEKFYRGRRGNELNVQGSGLGLALAKAAVEAHRGSIAVRTVPGKGPVPSRQQIPPIGCRASVWKMGGHAPRNSGAPENS
jgi:signal transduction histidine kinase